MQSRIQLFRARLRVINNTLVLILKENKKFHFEKD